MRDYPDLRVIAVPYDAGHPGLRMGAGPEHLLDNGLAETLRSTQRSLNFTIVRPEGETTAEVAAAFELDGLVSQEVREALSWSEFPLVLSGNCNTAVGTIAGASAGAGSQGLGIVWFDGHADFNTPETTMTGFTDNMGLAIAVGHCWKAMSESVPGFSPVAEEHVVLVGAREIESAEEERLEASGVTLVGEDTIGEDGLTALAGSLDSLKTKVGRVYVHLDLDVLDPSGMGRANEFAPEGGMSAEDLEMALSMVRERFIIAAAGIASYDPAFDAEGRILRTAISCIKGFTSPTTPR